jgi:Tfp pilus assembly protein PilF
MAEWSKAPDSKSGLGQPNGGSNPSLSATQMPPRGGISVASARVRTAWFDKRGEQCERRAGRRGEAHGGPERGAKRQTRDARIAERRGAHNPSLSATFAHSSQFSRAAGFLLVCWTALAPLQAMGQSRDPDAAFQRGVALQEAGRFAEAIKAYDEAIQTGSNYLVAYNNRGAAFGALKQYERAIPDFDLAIQLNPKYTEAYCNRGAAFGALKQYARAIKDFDTAIQIDPKYARAYNNLAWLLATAEGPSARDGRRALELALKACELSGCQDGYLLDTLGAAYARVGDFAKAIEWQSRAMANPSRTGDKESQMRLQAYREGKAWPP